MLHSLLLRLRALLTRSRHRQQLADELAFHQAMLEERFVNEGLPPEEAAPAARRRFGSAPRRQERVAELWQWTWLENLARDVSYAARLARIYGCRGDYAGTRHWREYGYFLGLRRLPAAAAAGAAPGADGSAQSAEVRLHASPALQQPPYTSRGFRDDLGVKPHISGRTRQVGHTRGAGYVRERQLLSCDGSTGGAWPHASPQR